MNEALLLSSPVKLGGEGEGRNTMTNVFRRSLIN